MGLLDDAIREHLELKRLRGADPGAVARQEQDALGPVYREGDTESAGEHDGFSEGAKDTKDVPGENESPPTLDADALTVGQETIEINMEDELAGGVDQPGEGGIADATPTSYPAHAHEADEESLEWEVPGQRGDGEGTAGTVDTRSSTDRDDDGQRTPEYVEDVLEETPDFLRDTPEQERLWFEQRPPRDFDFNE